ncbi:sodium/solute symporter [Winogradskyella sp. 3972H.M.0a.05]|uniref:sodium:solute symporter family transporter n=1 Tax=Winogradskyella sp. 3972H.M.0a.05 TaxID=2950277 RepID=UPI003398A706
MEQLDIIILVAYLLVIVGIGIYLSRKESTNAKDYFFASNILPWWAIGGSLIASNISAEQFIGMSGSGYVVGLAIASYEWLAALALLLVAKFFLPVFIKNEIYTMPQFLEKRFDNRVKTGMAIFWLFLFVFVNITSILYLGSLALKTLLGIPLWLGIIGLVLYSATFSIFGGLKTVVWTDVVQVVVLIIGGIIATIMILNAIDSNIIEALNQLYHKAPDKFDLILDKSNPEYKNLPGLSVLIGGIWVANLYYWGTNQYIIQRSLAAKSLKEAQLGTAFAALMKLLLPFIVVLPGIAAFVLDAPISKPDEAYPWIINNYVIIGFKGLAIAALIAAIGSSLSSMVNSTSTIFTLDIYEPFLTKAKENVSQKRLVKVGKMSSAVALIIGAIVAPLLGNIDQAFQFIQEYTGFISPGVVTIFVLGLFWKKMSSNAALWSVILSFPFSIFLKFLFPELPFMNRIEIVFALCMVASIGISIIESKYEKANYFYNPKGLFNTSLKFNALAFTTIGIITVIYSLFY